MEMDSMSDDSLYPFPGSPPEPLSKGPSFEDDGTKEASHQAAWDEYQRDRQLAEAHGEGLVVEEVAEEDMGYDADIEVLYPDAYEEPTEVKLAERVTAKRQALEHDVLWQSGIVDHMETLDCNSDANDSPRRTSWLKGRKRRSRTVSEIKRLQHVNSTGSSDFEITEIMDDEDGRFSPKRVRRRSKNLHQKLWSSPKYQSPSRDETTSKANGKRPAIDTPKHARSASADAMDVD